MAEPSAFSTGIYGMGPQVTFVWLLCSSMGQSHTDFLFKTHFKCVEFHKKCTFFFAHQAGHFIPPQLVSAAYLLLHSLWHDRRDAALTAVRKRL